MPAHGGGSTAQSGGAADHSAGRTPRRGRTAGDQLGVVRGVRLVRAGDHFEHADHLVPVLERDHDHGAPVGRVVPDRLVPGRSASWAADGSSQMPASPKSHTAASGTSPDGPTSRTRAQSRRHRRRPAPAASRAGAALDRVAQVEQLTVGVRARRSAGARRRRRGGCERSSSCSAASRRRWRSFCERVHAERERERRRERRAGCPSPTRASRPRATSRRSPSSTRDLTRRGARWPPSVSGRSVGMPTKRSSRRDLPLERGHGHGGTRDSSLRAPVSPLNSSSAGRSILSRADSRVQRFPDGGQATTS